MALINTERLSQFWTNAKNYIDTALAGKANTGHTHDYAASSHTHAQSDVTGLAAALSAKANATHTHTEYAATNHTHTAYAAASHTHSYNDLTNKPTIPTIEIATEAEIDALFA